MTPEKRQHLADYYRLRYQQSADVRQTKKEQGRKRRCLLRQEVLEFYSDGLLKCALCEEKRIGTLTIDHVNGGGCQHRKEIKRRGNRFFRWLRQNKFPAGYQVLCMNCNFLEHLKSNKKDWVNTPAAIRHRKRRHNLKEELLSHLGKFCTICNTTDFAVLTIHHTNNDGSAHRKKISYGTGGANFWHAVLKTDDFSGLECRCLSCNCLEEWNLDQNLKNRRAQYNGQEPVPVDQKIGDAENQKQQLENTSL